MARIPALSRAEMDAEQQKVYDETVATTGRVGRGPSVGYAHSPGLWRVQNASSAHLLNCSLTSAQVRIVSLMTARHWNAAYPWSAQAAMALKVGVDRATIELIDDLGVTDILIAGGTGTVSTGIEASFASKLGGSDAVVRLAGQDRYSTAAAVNSAVFERSEYALIASGTSFPDALAGGPLAGMLGAPIHLSPGSCIPAWSAGGIVESGVLGVVLLGGTGALTSAVEELAICG